MRSGKPVALLAALAALWSTGCREEAVRSAPATEPRAESKPPAVEWYRAVMVSDKGEEIPFFVKLAKGAESAVVDGSAFRATLAWNGPEVVVDFPLAQTRITATEGADGTLTGRWTSHPKGWKEASLAFRATPIADPDPTQRFASPPAGAPPASADGVWKVTLEESGPAKLVVASEATGVRATLSLITGNTVSLRGVVHGNQLKLSAFDAQSPYLILADLSGGSIKGRWLSGPGLTWRETFEGARSDDFPFDSEIRVAGRGVKLKLAALDAPQYRDKPVLISLSGSWCPACAFAAPFLVTLYDRYRERGLEMLTLNYEFTDDTEHNRRRTAQYVEEHGFKWNVLPIDGDMEAAMDIIPKELDNVNPGGFPIAMFVRRDRTIAAVVSGFPPPEAVESHKQMTEKYTTLVERILAGGETAHPASKRPRPPAPRP